MPPPKPPISANTMGTVTSATSGESRLDMIRYMKVMTIPKPSAVSIDVSSYCVRRRMRAAQAG